MQELGGGVEEGASRGSHSTYQGKGAADKPPAEQEQ